MTKELAKVRRYGKVVYDWSGRMIYYVNKKNLGAAAFSFEVVKTLEANGDVILINGKKWTLESTSRMGIMPIGAVCDDEEYHRLYVEKLRLSAEGFKISEALSLTASRMNLVLDEKAHELERDTTFWLSAVSLDDTYEKRRDFFWARGLDPRGFYQATMQQALYIQERAELEQVVNGVREIEPYLLPVLEGLKLIAYAPYPKCVKYVCTKDGKSWSVVDEDLKQEKYAPENDDLSEAVKFALHELKSKEY